MVVKIYFYDEEKEIEAIPISFEQFADLVGNLFGFQEIEAFTFEYTFDNKKFFLLNQNTYNDFYNNNQNAKVYIYPDYEESNYYKQEQDKAKEEEENNNNIIIEEDKKIIEKEEDNKNEEKENIIEDKEEKEEINNNEIKLPEITKDMVIASIVKQVKERRQQSLIQLEKERKEKEKKEKEKKKKEKEKKKKEEEKKKKEEKKPKDDFVREIGNLINNRVEDFKKELINQSKIKLNEMITESQIQMKKLQLENQNEKSIHSLEKHPNIACSKCGISPIVGDRYCCMKCDNVNFCDKCEEEIGFEHNHPLYKFKLRIE